MVRIPIEELVKLKEEGMTDRKIAEYLTGKGIKISAGTVNAKLKEYYESVGKIKPRGKMIRDNELEIMKEQKKTDREIAEYFTKQGRKICLCTVNKRLTKHYKSKNKIKPRSRRNTLIKNEISNEEIIELRNNGMTLREISYHFLSQGKEISHTAISSRLKNAYNTENEKDLVKKSQPKEEGFRERLKVTVIPIINEKSEKNDSKFDRER